MADIWAVDITSRGEVSSCLFEFESNARLIAKVINESGEEDVKATVRQEY